MYAYVHTNDYSFHFNWYSITACFIPIFNYICTTPIPSSFLLHEFPNWIWILFLPCCCVLLKFIFILASTKNSVFDAELFKWMCKNIYNKVRYFTLPRTNSQKLDFDSIIEIYWISIGSAWGPWFKTTEGWYVCCKQLRPFSSEGEGWWWGWLYQEPGGKFMKIWVGVPRSKLLRDHRDPGQDLAPSAPASMSLFCSHLQVLSVQLNQGIWMARQFFEQDMDGWPSCELAAPGLGAKLESNQLRPGQRVAQGNPGQNEVTWGHRTFSLGGVVTMDLVGADWGPWPSQHLLLRGLSDSSSRQLFLLSPDCPSDIHALSSVTGSCSPCPFSQISKKCPS